MHPMSRVMSTPKHILVQYACCLPGMVESGPLAPVSWVISSCGRPVRAARSRCARRAASALSAATPLPGHPSSCSHAGA